MNVWALSTGPVSSWVWKWASAVLALWSWLPGPPCKTINAPKAPATVVYKPLGNVSENCGHSGYDYTNCAPDILCLVLFRIAPSECATYITHLPVTVPISPVEPTARSTFHLCGWPLVWRQACLKRSRLFAHSACTGHHISQVIQQSIGLPE